MIDHSKPDQESKDKRSDSSVKKEAVFFGKGMIAAILGIVALLIIIVMMTTGGASGGNTVPAQQCANKMINYVNNNLVQPGSTASFISVNETKGLYEVKVNYQNHDISLYATKDCSLIFTNAINMDIPQPTPVSTQPPIKNTRPSVDLFVMAFCPYGTQAETAINPVVDLLGSKANISVRYITTISGTTIDSIQSLHGPLEAQEDLRQTCIHTYYPEKFWSYVSKFNTECYPQASNPENLNSCWKNTSAMLGIDVGKIQSCASGSEGLALLKVDESDSQKLGATASPTLLINGIEYTGPRTPEGYKQAICASFDTPPTECNTTLSSASVTSSGGGCG